MTCNGIESDYRIASIPVLFIDLYENLAKKP